MKIGELNSLKISRFAPQGAYLEDEAGEAVLLPKKYLNGEEEEGQDVEVFIYNDSEDRLVATTENPSINLNEFALLKVVDVSKFGVFLDWGLEKDLLVPFKEQNKKMQLGQSYVVRLILDEDTDRLIASARIKRYLSNEELEVEEKDKVELIIFNESEMGFEAIINSQHLGLIFKNEVFTSLKMGDRMTGYVKHIRPDKKIDVTLQPPMAAHVGERSEYILNLLKEQGGRLEISDKSSPDEIYAALQMSKKVFKKAIGNLYKQRLIEIDQSGISLKK